MSIWPVVGAVGASLIGGLFGDDANDDARDAALAAAEDSKERAGEAASVNFDTINLGYGDSQQFLQEGAAAGADFIQPMADEWGQRFDEAQDYLTSGAGDAINTIQPVGDLFFSEYGAAQDNLRAGAQGALGQINPMITEGDAARSRYNQAVGIDGEAARSAYVNDLLKRPEFTAARDRALRSYQDRYGAAGKSGSGAFYRGLQQTDLENATNYINTDLARLSPTVQAGTTARNTAAGIESGLGTALANTNMNMSSQGGAAIRQTSDIQGNLGSALASNSMTQNNQGAIANQQLSSINTNLGTSLAGNAIAQTNALVGNQDQFTTSVINANAGQAATTANAALASGANWGNAFGGLSKALGSYAGYNANNNNAFKIT